MGFLLRPTAALALAFCTTAIVTPAMAQSTGGQAANPTGNEVGAVIVTARKTGEDVRDIPSTVTAVTSDQLEAAGPVTGTESLVDTVPGVRFNNLTASNLSEISIRGSGTERATGADSGVGLFVNGAYAGSSTLGGRNFKNIDFFDISRVEVLEGPQSALYGRNSEFGVVNLVLAKPQFENSGSINETYTGTLNKNQLIGIWNAQLSDDFAVRLGAESIGQTKGFYYNPDNNSYYDQTSGWIGRAQARYKKGPLDVTLLVDAQDLSLPVFSNADAIAPGTLATIPQGYTSPNRFVLPSNGINDTQQKVHRAQLLSDIDLGFGTLSSTTMYTQSHSLQWFGSTIDLGVEAQLQAAGEAGAYPLSQVHTIANDQTYYEDLHLAGKAMDDKLQWLVGAEYLRQYDLNVVQTATNPCGLTATSSICGGTPTAPVCYKLIPAAVACPTPFPLAFGAVSTTPQHYQSKAAYASLSYTFKRLTFAGELRYTNDQKQAVPTTTALYTGTVTSAPNSLRFSATKPSYGLTASYKLSENADDMFYAKVGTGYRSGGVNGGTSTPLAPVPFSSTYDDETTISYEVGFKGSLGSHVFVTLDGYQSRTGDAITSINDGCSALNVCKQGPTIFNINGGTVHANGVELAINTRFQVAGGRLNLSLNGAHQHATFVAVNGTSTGLPIVGSSVAQIPDWTSSISLDYLRPLTSHVDGFFHAAYHSQTGGGQDTVTAAAPLISLASLNDVSLRWGLDYKKFEGAIFVTNATNETVKMLILASAGGVVNSIRYNQPRTIGLNLSYKY